MKLTPYIGRLQPAHEQQHVRCVQCVLKAFTHRTDYRFSLHNLDISEQIRS